MDSRGQSTAEALEAHYRQTLGVLPGVMQSMVSMDPEWVARYQSAREHIFTDRPEGLSPAMKELLTVVCDVAAENPEGAKTHLAAAVRHGLTGQQLAEALEIVHWVFGVRAWGLAGAATWDEWERLAVAEKEK